MTEYNTWNVKLSKSKFEIKNGAEVTLKLL